MDDKDDDLAPRTSAHRWPLLGMVLSVALGVGIVLFGAFEMTGAVSTDAGGAGGLPLRLAAQHVVSE